LLCIFQIITNKDPKLMFRLILLLTSVLILTGCGGGNNSADGGKASYAFVTNGVDPFWTLAESGVKAAAADLQVKADVLMPAAGAVEQKSMLEDLMTRGTTGIAVSPIDAANQTDFLNQVAEQTILITQDSDAPDSSRRVYIGMDNYDAGRECGALVKEALPEGGTVMILVGRMEQDNARRRRQGVIDELMDRSHDNTRFDPPGAVIKGEKYTILGTLTDQFDRAKAKANAEDTLARNPDIGAMVGLFAYNPPLILEALEQAGKLKEVKVIGFDEAERTLQGIIDGDVQGTVVQNPYMYGYKSIEVLNALHNGTETGADADGFINISARQIKKDNVEEFWADLKKKLGK
jgi:ribose transport system substrate-binding protein